jgi:guanylate kinase
VKILIFPQATRSANPAASDDSKDARREILASLAKKRAKFVKPAYKPLLREEKCQERRQREEERKLGEEKAAKDFLETRKKEVAAAAAAKKKYLQDYLEASEAVPGKLILSLGISSA